MAGSLGAGIPRLQDHTFHKTNGGHEDLCQTWCDAHATRKLLVHRQRARWCGAYLDDGPVDLDVRGGRVVLEAVDVVGGDEELVPGREEEAVGLLGHELRLVGVRVGHLERARLALRHEEHLMMKRRRQGQLSTWCGGDGREV